MKREHKVFEKEIESLRKKTEEFKHNHDKLARL
jgi:type VI protein secretion system component VasA